MIIDATANIKTAAAIVSMQNDIDQLAVLSAKIKRLEEITSKLKDSIANEYGEGKHRGEKYGVTVTLCNTSKVDYKKLFKDFGITEEQVAKYKTSGASIRVSATA